MPVTDEEAALQAITTFVEPLSPPQQEAKTRIDTILASSDAIVDIHTLFSLYNTLYFRSLLLPRVEVSWSSRLTLCAGICELVRDPVNGNKYTRIRLKLSEPLLKFRERREVVDTLLHEAIHAYFFITTFWRHSRGDDGTGHGAGFLLLADAINSHGGYGVSVYHSFHDEVESYRTHVWQCDGPCRLREPFFGTVKRAMNRAPGKGDQWWARHVEECGGTFVKIAEPEVTQKQLEKMSGLKRAGLQKSKIDGWLRGDEVGRRVNQDVGTKRDLSPVENSSTTSKKAKTTADCPICGDTVCIDEMNDHLDRVHSL